MRSIRGRFLTIAVVLAALMAFAVITSSPPAAADEQCPAGWVALTYDDGPVAERTDAILAALAPTNTRATFFAVGRRVARWPDVALDVARRGNAVGNHTWGHLDMRRLTDAEISSSVLRTDVALRAIGIRPLRIVEPPFLGAGSRVTAALHREAFSLNRGNVDPKDWRGDVTAAQVADRVVAGARDGAVIELHDGHKFFEKTAAATGEIIDRLTAAGFCFGVLDPHGDIVPPPPDGAAYRVPDHVAVNELTWIHYLMGTSP